MNLNEVLKSRPLRMLVNVVCGNDIDTVKRPASFVIRPKNEDEREIRRIIILPPYGYTADKLEQTNSHDEAEYATIEIKGAVRSGKNGFSKIKDCLLVASFGRDEKASVLDKPYMVYDTEKLNDPGLTLNRHSAGEPPIAVVKKDGYGFYHNLVNLTDEWLVLELYKVLHPQKSVELENIVKTLPAKDAKILNSFYCGVLAKGDELFKTDIGLIEEVCDLPLENTLPALTEMLFVHDTGRHEACSVFAVILKIAKNTPQDVMDFLENAMERESVPKYYARQLIEKINKRLEKTAGDAGKPESKAA